MKLVETSLLLLAVLGLSLPASANIPPMSKAHRLSHLGRIQVGDSIDALPSVLAEKNRFGLHKLSHRFHVYVFAHELPYKCLNLQCGTFARRVVASGGFLVGGGDSHYIRELGEQDERTPVVLVTDRADKVVAIYEDASVPDLSRILSEMEDAR